MTINEAIRERHSVRGYLDKPIPADIRAVLEGEIAQSNLESGLNIQAVWDEPKAFGGLMARYGKFKNANNYILLIGKKSESLNEMAGYYGERIVLVAQTLGLNTCWVALTFSKGAARKHSRIREDEKLACAISIGYGETQGVSHHSRPLEELYTCAGEMPDWFKKGIEAAALAPTAMNQQKFRLTFKGEKVEAKALPGSYTSLDLGIVKYHFEIGSGKGSDIWLPV